MAKTAAPAASTDTTVLTLHDLCLFEHVKRDKFGKDLFTRFCRTQEGPSADERWVKLGSLIERGLQINSQGVLEAKMLHNLGFLSKAGYAVYDALNRQYDRVAKENGKLVLFRFVYTAEELSDMGSWGRRWGNFSIADASQRIKEGEETTFKSARTDIGLTRKIEIKDDLPQTGFKAIVKLANEVLEIKKTLPSPKEIAARPITDEMIAAAREALEKIDFSADQIKQLMRPGVHRRLPKEAAPKR